MPNHLLPRRDFSLLDKVKEIKGTLLDWLEKSNAMMSCSCMCSVHLYDIVFSQGQVKVLSTWQSPNEWLKSLNKRKCWVRKMRTGIKLGKIKILKFRKWL